MSSVDSAAMSRELLRCQTSQDLFAFSSQFLSDAGVAEHAVVFFDATKATADVCVSTLTDLDNVDRFAVPAPWRSMLASGASCAKGDAATQAIPAACPSVQTLYPLLGRGGAFGAVVAANDVPADAHELVRQFSEQLALMIPHVQLREELKRVLNADVAKLALIAETRKVLRELDLEIVLAKFLELAMTTVSAEVGCIVLPTEGGQGEVVEWGIDASIVEQLLHRDGQPLSDYVIEHQTPVVIVNESDADLLVRNEISEISQTLAAIPLVSRGRCLGCLLVINLGLADPASVELLQAVADLSTTAIANALLHREALQQEAVREQLRIAGDLQASLLPGEVPADEGLDVYATNVPCDESGGDYYDFFSIDEHRTGFLIADATGHGIGAAIIATLTHAFIRALIKTTTDPSELLTQANDLLSDDLSDDKFITAFFGIYDRRDRTVQYANAGHEPALLVYRREQDAFEWLESTGIPLGMFPGVEVDKAQAGPFDRGDILLLMSDGVPEAQCASGEQFGKERIFAQVREHAKQGSVAVGQSLLASVEAFCGGTPQDDDITVLALTVADA